MLNNEINKIEHA